MGSLAISTYSQESTVHFALLDFWQMATHKPTRPVPLSCACSHFELEVLQPPPPPSSVETHKVAMQGKNKLRALGPLSQRWATVNCLKYSVLQCVYHTRTVSLFLFAGDRVCVVLVYLWPLFVLSADVSRSREKCVCVCAHVFYGSGVCYCVCLCELVKWI